MIPHASLTLAAALLLLAGCGRQPATAPPAAPAANEPWYRLAEHVRLRRDAAHWILTAPARAYRIPLAQTADCLLVQNLESEYLSTSQIVASVGITNRHGSALPGGAFPDLLEGRWLRLQWRRGETLILTVNPAPPVGSMASPNPAPRRLSRFAYLHRQDQRWLLESPLSPHQVEIHDLALLPSLLGPPSRATGSEAAARDLWPTLAAARLTVAADDAEGRDGQGPLAFWSFHDLAFHGRSLSSRQGDPAMGTFPWQDTVPSLPAVKPVAGDSVVVVLPDPTAPQLEALRRPFLEVVQSRRSIRAPQTASLLGIADLGALLTAAAKVQRVEELPGHADAVSFRPSPSAGARHPLEIYVLARACAGLEPGLYRYDPLGHRLVGVPLRGDRAAELRDWHPFAAWDSPPPPVILLFTARVGRTAWKYEDISYRLIQNDLGALYQTLYLGATALGLGPCVIGNVSSPLFAEVTDIDDLAEPWLGAMTLYH